MPSRRHEMQQAEPVQPGDAAEQQVQRRQGPIAPRHPAVQQRAHGQRQQGRGRGLKRHRHRHRRQAIKGEAEPGQEGVFVHPLLERGIHREQQPAQRHQERSRITGGQPARARSKSDERTTPWRCKPASRQRNRWSAADPRTGAATTRPRTSIARSRAIPATPHVAPPAPASSARTRPAARPVAPRPAPSTAAHSAPPTPGPPGPPGWPPRRKPRA